MKHRKTLFILCAMMTIALISTSALAFSESDVESAIAGSSQEEVSGNLLIWFLCAVSFLKISQKIDSFMTSLGINVGRTGGSMLAELMIAGRAIGGAVKATSGAIGSIFNRGSSSNSTNTTVTGQAFTGGGNGMLSIAKCAVGNAAAASAVDRSTGLSSIVGGAMFSSSLNSGGEFATDVVGAVATGNISKVGSITGAKAARALSNYLGYSPSGNSVAPAQPHAGFDSGSTICAAASTESDSSEDAISIDGGIAGANVPFAGSSPIGAFSSESTNTAGASQESAIGQNPIPTQPPTFRDVEIGGGRITGFETPAGGGEERQFAMYKPTGSHH